MLDDFLLRALFAGFAVALVAGPLGTFVVWRRMAYFGDTLAHSALLGVALGFVLGISLNLAVILVSIVIAVALLALQQRKQLASDTLLGILAHAALSIGLVVMAFQENLRLDLMAYLFGDILAISNSDLWWVWGGTAVVALMLLWIWRPLLALTVHEELARVEGVPVILIRLVFMLLIALVIAISMKIIGMLLITALLIIPAATARRFSRTPEQMAIVASLVGLISVASGLFGSLSWDTPAGPSIVVAAAILFSLTQLTRQRR